ncbi:MAG: carboxymuconolactone decarboxylase family protein, partial [Salinisphaera sp.]|nr:carboxymuconolactone decarboxylase family protein [Salinisphaera sp.]
MSESLFPASTAAVGKRRKALAPQAHEAFQAFSKAVFADGELDGATKQLIAVAVAHTTQCPW